MDIEEVDERKKIKAQNEIESHVLFTIVSLMNSIGKGNGDNLIINIERSKDALKDLIHFLTFDEKISLIYLKVIFEQKITERKLLPLLKVPLKHVDLIEQTIQIISIILNKGIGLIEELYQEEVTVQPVIELKFFFEFKKIFCDPTTLNCFISIFNDVYIRLEKDSSNFEFVKDDYGRFELFLYAILNLLKLNIWERTYLKEIDGSCQQMHNPLDIQRLFIKSLVNSNVFDIVNWFFPYLKQESLKHDCIELYSYVINNINPFCLFKDTVEAKYQQFKVNKRLLKDLSMENIKKRKMVSRTRHLAVMSGTKAEDQLDRDLFEKIFAKESINFKNQLKKQISFPDYLTDYNEYTKSLSNSMLELVPKLLKNFDLFTELFDSLVVGFDSFSYIPVVFHYINVCQFLFGYLLAKFQASFSSNEDCSIITLDNEYKWVYLKSREPFYNQIFTDIDFAKQQELLPNFSLTFKCLRNEMLLFYFIYKNGSKKDPFSFIAAETVLDNLLNMSAIVNQIPRYLQIYRPDHISRTTAEHMLTSYWTVCRFLNDRSPNDFRLADRLNHNNILDTMFFVLEFVDMNDLSVNLAVIDLIEMHLECTQQVQTIFHISNLLIIQEAARYLHDVFDVLDKQKTNFNSKNEKDIFLNIQKSLIFLKHLSFMFVQDWLEDPNIIDTIIFNKKKSKKYSTRTKHEQLLESLQDAEVMSNFGDLESQMKADQNKMLELTRWTEREETLLKRFVEDNKNLRPVQLVIRVMDSGLFNRSRHEVEGKMREYGFLPAPVAPVPVSNPNQMVDSLDLDGEPVVYQTKNKNKPKPRKTKDKAHVSFADEIVVDDTINEFVPGHEEFTADEFAELEENYDEEKEEEKTSLDDTADPETNSLQKQKQKESTIDAEKEEANSSQTSRLRMLYDDDDDEDE
eukprot:TRINITY_DN2578_c0_g1_i1.p1 TRINITY_DN2578_c0_g1~~TRINITY_DN2578_c0_g1_i1.p1  ORF type:complete len:912 (-),score=196.37 TRINITY_DN2578_c0_g1_i1:66-2801(-)